MEGQMQKETHEGGRQVPGLCPLCSVSHLFCSGALAEPTILSTQSVQQRFTEASGSGCTARPRCTQIGYTSRCIIDHAENAVNGGKAGGGGGGETWGEWGGKLGGGNGEKWVGGGKLGGGEKWGGEGGKWGETGKNWVKGGKTGANRPKRRGKMGGRGVGLGATPGVPYGFSPDTSQHWHRA